MCILMCKMSLRMVIDSVNFFLANGWHIMYKPNKIVNI